MRCLRLIELIALETAIVALLAAISSICIPELRRFLGLDPPIPVSKRSEKILKIIWILLIGLAVALVIWFFLCRTTASEVRPRPSPSPTPTPEGHVKEVGTVEVSGAKFTLYAFLPGYHWRYATVDAEFNRSLLT